jgi:type IV pilus assembly protein PilW
MRINSNKASGFTIIEMMIAMVLGLILIGGIAGLFAGSRQSFKVDEQVSRMQDEARFALDEIAGDLRMAGYLAEALVPAAITRDAGLAVGTDCGPAAQANWMLNFSDTGTGELNSLTTVDNATAAAAAAAYSCIAGSEIKANSDIVGIKRLAGGITATVENGATYIRSNGTVHTMYTEPPTTALTAPAPFEDWQYGPAIYFIQPFTQAGDGIPSLCRKVLTEGSPPNVTTECIAQGIEDLQIEFGIDTTGNGDPNRYLAAPTLAQLQFAVTARIFLLAQTMENDFSYTDDRTYALSNAPNYVPNDNYRRRVYSKTVAIHNLRNIKLLGF